MNRFWLISGSPYRLFCTQWLLVGFSHLGGGEGGGRGRTRSSFQFIPHVHQLLATVVLTIFQAQWAKRKTQTQSSTRAAVFTACKGSESSTRAHGQYFHPGRHKPPFVSFDLSSFIPPSAHCQCFMAFAVPKKKSKQMKLFGVNRVAKTPFSNPKCQICWRRNSRTISSKKHSLSRGHLFQQKEMFSSTGIIFFIGISI